MEKVREQWTKKKVWVWQPKSPEFPTTSFFPPSHHVSSNIHSFIFLSMPLLGYTPLSANRSAKSTAIKAQQASLLGLCLLTVAAIVSLGEEKNNTCNWMP